MKIKEYNEMIKHITRPGTPEENKRLEEQHKKFEIDRKNNKRKEYGLPPLSVAEKQIVKVARQPDSRGTFQKLVKQDEKDYAQQVKDYAPHPVPTTRLKPLIDIEKILEENEDNFVNNRGKQTEALIGTANKHIKQQINKGNIKKEDLILRADKNGLMTNKARTIALRDSFMAKQFNRALGVNDEPEATPEQVGALAERLERSRQMTGAKPTKLNDLKNRYKDKPFIKKKVSSTPVKIDFKDFKINPIPQHLFEKTEPDPKTEYMQRRIDEMQRQSEREKNSGLPGLRRHIKFI
jgi:hypothetical protein|tara:strand:+ start:1035 stop:1916 length:882 start_codon:yes stop_codon:yes gene_type:complete